MCICARVAECSICCNCVFERSVLENVIATFTAYYCQYVCILESLLHLTRGQESEGVSACANPHTTVYLAKRK
jgi:hypothetical protein